MVLRKSREHNGCKSIIVVVAHHVHDANVSRRALSIMLMFLAILPFCCCTSPRPPPPPSTMFTARRGASWKRNIDNSLVGFHYFYFAPAIASSTAKRARASGSTTRTDRNTSVPRKRVGGVDGRHYRILDGGKPQYFCRCGMLEMGAGRSQNDGCVEPCGEEALSLGLFAAHFSMLFCPIS